MILGKVKINGYWGQECMRLGLFCGAGCILFIGLSCCVDVFLLLSSTVYIFQIFIYFTVKRNKKSLKHLTAIDYSVTQCCVKTNWWFAETFQLPISGVKISSFCSPRWVLGWSCSSAVSIMQGWSGSVGGEFQEAAGITKRLIFKWIWGLTLILYTLMALLQSQFFSC